MMADYKNLEAKTTYKIQSNVRVEKIEIMVHVVDFSFQKIVVSDTDKLFYSAQKGSFRTFC